jgi:hypothetical protein
MSFEFCALSFAFWVTSRNFDALVRQLRLKTQNAKRKTQNLYLLQRAVEYRN